MGKLVDARAQRALPFQLLQQGQQVAGHQQSRDLVGMQGRPDVHAPCGLGGGPRRTRRSGAGCRGGAGRSIHSVCMGRLLRLGKASPRIAVPASLIRPRALRPTARRGRHRPAAHRANSASPAPAAVQAGPPGPRADGPGRPGGLGQEVHVDQLLRPQRKADDQASPTLEAVHPAWGRARPGRRARPRAIARRRSGRQSRPRRASGRGRPASPAARAPSRVRRTGAMRGHHRGQQGQRGIPAAGEVQPPAPGPHLGRAGQVSGRPAKCPPGGRGPARATCTAWPRRKWARGTLRPRPGDHHQLGQHRASLVLPAPGLLASRHRPRRLAPRPGRRRLPPGPAPSRHPRPCGTARPATVSFGIPASLFPWPAAISPAQPARGPRPPAASPADGPGWPWAGGRPAGTCTSVASKPCAVSWPTNCHQFSSSLSTGSSCADSVTSGCAAPSQLRQAASRPWGRRRRGRRQVSASKPRPAGCLTQLAHWVHSGPGPLRGGQQAPHAGRLRHQVGDVDLVRPPLKAST